MPSRRTTRSPGRSHLPPHRTYESFFEHEALFEFSRVINSSMDQEFILSHILRTMMGKLLSVRGMILLGDGGNDYHVEKVKGFAPDLAGHSVRIDRLPESMFYLKDVKGRQYSWREFFRSHDVRIILPMMIANHPIGFLAFTGRVSRKRLKPQEETYFRSLANISAAAVEKTRTINEIGLINRQLDLKIQELNTLFDLSKEFGSLLDAEKLVRLLVFSLMGQIGVHRYLICLRSGPDMKIVASRIDGAVPQSRLLTELGGVRRASKIEDLVVRDVPEIRSVLEGIGMKVVVPMQVQGETRGLILLGEKLSREEFSGANLEFLASLANLAMISLENTRLFEEAIEKQRLEDELLIAREIQKGLLPSLLPTVGGVQVAAANISSKQVGGDYYDMLAAGEGSWIIAIGDVSGKGTPAALLMANLQATIRALVPLNLPLSELTGRVNDLMCENTGGSKFVTFFWGILNTGEKRLTYVNAGHNYPILLRSDGTVLRLSDGGMILGVLKTDAPYESGRVQLGHGDILTLFTDGVSEAMNRHSIEYGEDRLQEVIRAHQSKSADEILNAIHQDVQNHAGHAAQSDDITMMVLKFDSLPPAG